VSVFADGLGLEGFAIRCLGLGSLIDYGPPFRHETVHFLGSLLSISSQSLYS
jgi:hypothetical protein